MKNIALLGSTGSIGKSTLEVVRKFSNEFRIVSMAAGCNTELLTEQIREFRPECVSVKSKEDAKIIKGMFPEIKVSYGTQGIEECAVYSEADTLVAAIFGTIPLQAILLAIRRGMRICLANKETLVAAGDIIMHAIKQSDSVLIPIDSEQSAIFQAIGSEKRERIKRVLITASGGPFFKLPEQEFEKITLTQALKHPTWDMGPKITVDSATLMNKALEMIEARYLFDLTPEMIKPVIHPQSIVHSMVEYIDGSLLAQLSITDMQVPILYSLTYPERLECKSFGLDIEKMASLEFYEVDRAKFESVDMAYYVLEKGNNTGAVFNAANEVAVDEFVKERIRFSDIFTIVKEVLYNEQVTETESLEHIEEIIRDTKVKTAELISRSFN